MTFRTLISRTPVPAAFILPAAIVAALGGCSSSPSAIQPVAVDGKTAAAAAIVALDKNGDAELDDAELAAAPGMLKYKAKFDQNSDGRVSQDEIRSRIDLWADQGLGLKSVTVEVKLDGRTLPGAEVKFVPESFLGEGPKAASGITDVNGVTKVSVATEHLPEALQKARVRGLYGGLYRIEVTHPQRAIPSKYNSATTLGEEVAKDTTPDRITLDLRSR